jgi:hypothetical protein
VFCMGCGAELPSRTAVCAVCGRAAGQSGDQPGAPAVATTDPANALGADFAPRERLAPPAPTPTHAPSIGSGDLYQVGFPRDTLGRALIFTVLAMAADLLVPWIAINGMRVAPSSLGVLPLLGVVWLALAALPLLHPSLRATPLAAVLPLVVGAVSFGVALAVLLSVTALSTPTVNTGSSPYGIAPPVIVNTSSSADVGLYLFLAGAVVLSIAGYQVFLAEARAEAHAELRSQALLAAGAPPPAIGGERHGPTQSERAPAPASAAITPPPLPSPPAEAAPSKPAPAAADPGVALPGSAAWSQTPQTPAFQRPSPMQGWRHHGP